ncbi:unnamed protein product [Protopolystoma xenopodis]|uniref:Uncharacterized protein n=1 Tax=Protopolystoma xenopodis TaxID=117903 RepID=A0A3S5AWG4_9PLAT|nr:unnamed protein product [Protopolystoma xenopodis]
MAKLTDDAGETFENVPCPLFDAGNHDNYYVRDFGLGKVGFNEFVKVSYYKPKQDFRGVKTVVLYEEVLGLIPCDPDEPVLRFCLYLDRHQIKNPCITKLRKNMLNQYKR